LIIKIIEGNIIFSPSAKKNLMKKKKEDPALSLTKAIENSKTEKYLLRLFVTGNTPQSSRAIANIKNICEEHLKGRYELEVVDLYQQPELAKEEQILAAPTLIKKLPLPLRRIIGDLSNSERLIVGLDLQKIRNKK
jgi:circadian clock protein KaiB